jgi:hypothetical protein
MIPSTECRTRLNEIALASFNPRSQQEAVIQFLVVGLDRRAFHHANGTTFGLGWKIARQAIRNAQLLKRSTDWSKTFQEIIYGKRA